MPAYGSGTHWPLQHAWVLAWQSNTSKQPPVVELVVVEVLVVVATDVEVFGRRGLRRPRGPQTPPRHTRSNSPASMHATSFVQ